MVKEETNINEVPLSPEDPIAEGIVVEETGEDNK